MRSSHFTSGPLSQGETSKEIASPYCQATQGLTPVTQPPSCARFACVTTNRDQLPVTPPCPLDFEDRFVTWVPLQFVPLKHTVSFQEPEEQSQGCHSFGKNACMERCCHGLLASVTQPRLEADSGGNMGFMIPFVDCPKKTSTHGPSLGLSLQWASWSRRAAPL